MMRTLACVLLLALALGIQAPIIARQQADAKPQPPKTPRLYIFDCGLINVNRAGTERYKVTPEEVGETRVSVPCFLVVHPKGTLMWDLGIVPDDTVEARARGEQGNTTATSAAVATVTRTLASQLAELGYRPPDITYFRSRRVRRLRRRHRRPQGALGHSPGHQVLVLNLLKTGRVMIAGDLYHYPQERTLKRPPPDTEFNVQQSAASRVMIEEYLRKTKTEIWIEHDFVHNAKLKKSPQYYD